MYGKVSTECASRSNQSGGANYVFDWGSNKGKHINEVPQHYLASILSAPRFGQILEEREGLREALEFYMPYHPHLSSFDPTMLSSALPRRNSAPKSAAPAPDHVTGPPYSSGLVGSTKMVLDGTTDVQSQPVGPQAYRFTCRPYIGSTLAEVPVFYLRSLEVDGDIVKNNWEFWSALAHHEVESYRLDSGRLNGKRLDQISDAYLVALEQHTTDVGKNKSLQRALWYRNQQLGRSNERLGQTVEKYRNRMRLEH